MNIKKSHLIITILLISFTFFLVFSSRVFAQSGCCSWHGGESYCGANGRWVCNDGTYSPTCTCGGGYYIPPVPVVTPYPSCPLMATYNSLTNKCECMYGYVSNGSYCISEDQACSDKYGYHSTSDYTGGCKCRYGYIWNNSKTSCISGDTACHDQIGIMSSYNNLSNTCDCFPGYSIQGGTCLPIPVHVVKPYSNPVYIPTDTPEPNYSPIPTISKPKYTSMPTPTKNIVINQPSLTPKTVATPSATPFIKGKEPTKISVLGNLVNFIKSIFRINAK